MSIERKDVRLNARVPASVVTRLDYVVRNTENRAVRNRSTGLLVALEAWLIDQEERLRVLGVLPKKSR
jgi:hypothetical protein